MLAQSLPPALVTALREHNGEHPGPERIRLRMALHAGEVHYDQHGVTAVAVNLAFRLLDAGPLKEALASSSGVLAIIVSSWFFEEVVRHGGAAPGYRPVKVAVKETTTIGWICLPDQVTPEGWSGSVDQLAMRSALAEQDGRRAGQMAAARALRLAPRPVFLAGREELLAELDARLARKEGVRPRVMALCGLGGAGKTSVALEYAHRLLDEVGVAWQFGAEDPAVLAAGFGELATQLGAADRGDPAAAVHAVLAAYPAEWLLVFDNAPDRASVAAFLPPAGRGRVLITSRSQIWPSGQALDVPVLDVGVAANFIVNRTGDPDRRAAQELAVELGCLPLALEQAAAYIHASGDNLAGYLGSFRQRRAELLARGEPTGYSETVATTWALAFGHLHEDAPRAVGLLRLLANCAPEAIPLKLLLRPRPGLDDRFGPEVAPVLVPLLEDGLAAKDAIAALRRYSLVTPAADGSVSVHRLVQAVTLGQMPDNLAKADHPDLLNTLYHLARFSGLAGDPAGARDRLAALVPVRARILGADHPDTVLTRQSLAYWMGQAGDPAGARDQLTALMPVAERVLGAEHPETLTARQHLIRWTGQAGDRAGARDQFAALVQVIERVLSPEHPDTLTARGHLAYWTGRAGDRAGARDQFAALVPVIEQVLGPEHPDTLTARHELARWTGQAGDPAGARNQLAALVPVRIRILGADHPDTQAVSNNLTYWTWRANGNSGPVVK